MLNLIALNRSVLGIKKPDIGMMVRVFANGTGDLCSIPGGVIPKTQKMVLDASLFNTQHYKVRIKGKVEQSRERSSAPLHLGVETIEKGAFGSPSTNVANFTYLWIKRVLPLNNLKWLICHKTKPSILLSISHGLLLSARRNLMTCLSSSREHSELSAFWIVFKEILIFLINLNTFFCSQTIRSKAKFAWMEKISSGKKKRFCAFYISKNLPNLLNNKRKKKGNLTI